MGQQVLPDPLRCCERSAFSTNPLGATRRSGTVRRASFMSKSFSSRSYDDEPDTVPSRLGELTLRSRLEQEEQYRNGWRRNLSIAVLLVVACILGGYFLH